MKSFQDLTDAIGREEGQGLVEYALILSVIALGCVITLSALTGAIGGVFTTLVGVL